VEGIPPDAEVGGGGRQRTRQRQRAVEDPAAAVDRGPRGCCGQQRRSDAADSQSKTATTPSAKNSMAAAAVPIENRPGEAAQASCVRWQQAYDEEATHDEQGEKIARSAACKIEEERGTNSNPNL
jgi:hypothetical protein